MMTRKDYVKLAQAIAGVDCYEHQGDIVFSKNGLIWALVLVLEEDNPRFDENKFEQACYE